MLLSKRLQRQRRQANLHLTVLLNFFDELKRRMPLMAALNGFRRFEKPGPLV